MSITLTVALVLAADGTIDQDQSEQAFHGALVKRTAELETEQVEIAEAVSALFDQYPGASINMPAVASMTAQRLNAQPENFKVLSDRVLDYVRQNAQGDTAKDGSVERPDSLFVIGKGKGGGCYRRADKPAKTDTK